MPTSPQASADGPNAWIAAIVRVNRARNDFHEIVVAEVQRLCWNGGSSMSDSSGATSLSLDDVVKLITAARAGMTDPVSTCLAIFQDLGENAVLSGDVLREALSQASLALEGPLADVLAAVGSITKTGSLITAITYLTHPQ